jgi:HD-GYP domain-containing protein (c-di-GMP phosphodiesterase class II)
MRSVIISRGAEPFIDYENFGEMTVEKGVSVPGIISRLLSLRRHEPHLILFFIHAGEYSGACDRLRESDLEDIFYSFVIFGSADEMKTTAFRNMHHVSEFRISPPSKDETSFIMEKSFSILEEFASARATQNEYLNRLVDTIQDQEDLIDIGRSLSSEKDPEKLLSLILTLSKKITGADAGSIYLVEEDEKGKKRLRFKTSHTYSRDIPLNEFVMPLNKESIAGYVAVTGEVLNIPDVYKLKEMNLLGIIHDSSFDKKHNYLTRSMLVVPMRNHHDEIIGVIQLINSKEYPDKRDSNGNEAFSIRLETLADFDRHVVAFDEKYDGLLQAIAGQAAIAIENNRMIRQIQTQFEEFVRASVTAIESRDPATSGHSFRVAKICTAMARAINEIDDGYLANFSFTETAISELEFAALLHDFGKVYVDLNIFRKEKKLYPRDMDNLMIRLDYLYRYVELQYRLRETQVECDQGSGSETIAAEKSRLDAEMSSILDEIKEIKGRIRILNEPTVMDKNPEETIDEITSRINALRCVDVDGGDMNVITDSDRMNLIIRRGSLNPLERKEIESHVVHTYSFVSKIPWPPEYRNIPEIALRHHEKIDGSGYPDGLKGRESTMIQARIMAIADIFDALASPDRPYKKACPWTRCFPSPRGGGQGSAGPGPGEALSPKRYMRLRWTFSATKSRSKSPDNLRTLPVFPQNHDCLDKNFFYGNICMRLCL